MDRSDRLLFLKKNHFLIAFLLLWILSFAVQFALADGLKGFLRDQTTFIQWMNETHSDGIQNAYKMFQMNYPPLFIFVLYFYQFILTGLFHVQAVPGHLSFKWLIVCIDFLLFGIVYWVYRSKIRSWRTFLPLVFIFLNPALLFDGSVWGQIDLLFSVLMVISLVVLKKYPFLSGALFALALFTKLQSIVVAPVIFFYLIKNLRNVRHWVKYALGFVVPCLFFGIYFLVNHSLINMVKQAYLSAVGFFPRLSMNALNIWFYAAGFSPKTKDSSAIIPGLSFKHFGLLLLFLAVCWTAYYLFKIKGIRTTHLLKAGMFLSFSFFMLPTEIHERYSIPAVVVCLFLLFYDRKYWRMAALLTFTSFVNIASVLYTHLHLYDIWIVYLNVLIYVLMIRGMMKETGR